MNRTIFECDDSLTSITRRCEMQASVMEDGRTLNVIDTPGLYDSEIERDFNQKEIMKCIDLAKDGIHAVLIVFSIQNRYSKEEGHRILSQTLHQSFTNTPSSGTFHKVQCKNTVGEYESPT